METGSPLEELDDEEELLEDELLEDELLDEELFEEEELLDVELLDDEEDIAPPEDCPPQPATSRTKHAMEYSQTGLHLFFIDVINIQNPVRI